MTANFPETGSSIEERAEDWISAALDESVKQPPSRLSKRKPLPNQKPLKIAKAICLC